MKYNIVSAKSQEKSTNSQSPIVITQRLLPKQNRIPERIENGIVLGRTNRILAKHSTILARMLIPHVFEEFTLYGTKDHNPLKDRFAVIRVFLESKSITEFAERIAVVIADQNYNKLPTDQKEGK